MMAPSSSVRMLRLPGPEPIISVPRLGAERSLEMRFILETHEDVEGARRFLDGIELFLVAFRNAPELDDDHIQALSAWEGFLGEHPELSAEPPSHIAGPIDPDAVYEALVRVLDNPDRREHLRGAADTSTVGVELWPDVKMVEHFGPHKNGQATSAQHRLAHVLRKLADEGRIVRLRAKDGSANMWTLEGRELGSRVAKNWRRDA